MSFLARNEYLLEEIDYYHEQISARLAEEAWSENYRQIWANVCRQLGWHDLIPPDGPGERLVRTLFQLGAGGRGWLFDSPVLREPVELSRTENIACRTIFGFALVIGSQEAGEPLALGMCAPGETLALLRLLPYFEYFIDVGAGNGYFAFLAAQQGVAVTAFEPSPAEYRRLKTGMAINGLGGIAAPVCSAGDSPAGGAVYVEEGPSVKPLVLADYRATGSLVRVAAGLEPAFLPGAGDWLDGYDAPAVLFNGGAPASSAPPLVAALAKRDYRVFAVNRPAHGLPLLSAADGAERPTPACFLALPPMAHDLAGILRRPVDMRVFTPTAKLEYLYHFVKSSFEEV